jgi:hypothetical protein
VDPAVESIADEPVLGLGLGLAGPLRRQGWISAVVSITDEEPGLESELGSDSHGGGALLLLE